MNENYEYSFEPQEESQPQTITFTQAPPEPQKHNSAVKLVALALCCSLAGGLLGAGGMLLGSKLTQDKQVQTADDSSTQILMGNRETQAVELKQVDSSKLMTAAEVYAANVNSTVGITTSVTTNYWGFQTTSAASGSGFILSADGYILTNYHVIEGSDSITVTLYDGTAYDAELVGYEESLDTAVLKVDAENLPPVILGSSDQINVGDSVIAIGNPLGELTFSLTAGAVSALDREVTMSNGVTMDLIQTDCAINSGNSGGALFNLYGEVIGITNAKYSGSGSEASIDNIGFAIPINDVMNIVTSIIENGYYAKPYIGVYTSDVTEQMKNYGLPQGAAVAQVAEGAPAEAAGLQANDIITAANDTEITGSGDLGDVIAACEVGDELTLQVYRQGETLTLTVEIGEQIQSPQQEEAQQQQHGYPWYPGGYGYGFGG